MTVLVSILLLPILQNQEHSCSGESRHPILIEHGTYTPVKAKLWPRLEPFSSRKSSNPFGLFPSRSAADILEGLARRISCGIRGRSTVYRSHPHVPLQFRRQKHTILRNLVLRIISRKHHAPVPTPEDAKGLGRQDTRLVLQQIPLTQVAKTVVEKGLD